MSRTWKTERSTPKVESKKAHLRPRVSEFAREYYQGLGYQVETSPEATVTPCGSTEGEPYG